MTESEKFFGDLKMKLSKLESMIQDMEEEDDQIEKDLNLLRKKFGVDIKKEVQ